MYTTYFPTNHRAVWRPHEFMTWWWMISFWCTHKHFLLRQKKSRFKLINGIESFAVKNVIFSFFFLQNLLILWHLLDSDQNKFGANIPKFGITWWFLNKFDLRYWVFPEKKLLSPSWPPWISSRLYHDSPGFFTTFFCIDATGNPFLFLVYPPPWNFPLISSTWVMDFSWKSSFTKLNVLTNKTRQKRPHEKNWWRGGYGKRIFDFLK